jgi:hypothetical protein
MQHKTILWFALVSSGLLSFGNTARCVDLPPFDTPTKLQLSGSWSNVTIKLVLPGSSNPPVKCTVEEIPAQRAVFKVIPRPPSPYWNEFSIIAVHEPHSGKNCLIAADHTFYALDKSGMTGYTVFTSGIYWLPSYLEVADAESNMPVAIAKFVKEFDGRKLNDGLLEERRVRLGFQKVSPLFYGLEKPVGGAKRVDMKIEAFEITDGVLRVDLRNPFTKAPASFWIEPQQRKIIKSVVDGQEMNVNTRNQPWADPLVQ